MEISIELRVLMTRSKVTGKELAKQTGMARSKISKILQGRQVPDWSEISAIANSCGYEPTLTFTEK